LIPVIDASGGADAGACLVVELHLVHIPLGNYTRGQGLSRRRVARHEDGVGLKLPAWRRTTVRLSATRVLRVFTALLNAGGHGFLDEEIDQVVRADALQWTAVSAIVGQGDFADNLPVGEIGSGDDSGEQ
jgi:hypothetical protein